MSRCRFPPTPAMSGEFIIKDQPADATDAFALPPAALGSSKVDDQFSRRSSRSDPTYVPASPPSPDLMARNRSTQQSRSGTATKRSLEDFELPPPPTRTRKIIQMKPKPQTTTKSPKKENGKAAQTSPESATKDATSSKRKQPSATSAAGRKIARKTAHSLIERRRRSKMNEEFGTLKDMIPACTGQEMHKLAILQASIDYVNYLERCIRDLKTAGATHTSAPPSPTSPEFITETGESSQHPQRPPSSIYSYSTSESPEIMPGSAMISDTSPSFSPRTRMPSVHTLPDISSVLPSPALGPINPAMDKLHDIQGIDHEASAALLMLTQDRRGTADSINEHFAGTSLSTPEEIRGGDVQRRKGMSVRDLLIS
ncbi:hypothetical protein N7520_009833 [Penicillium odoratum]|uniref:uncharacterized protein n=1 Tax=Penicillium odoratum TaxID=1167516 RepID=UPI002549A4D4|nr:uncharacterized protein N7520_009833 [Penicillium odoratum]KAJ5752916.1 hypothetical protein N7520_009833 [Penicillium odoratum]